MRDQDNSELHFKVRKTTAFVKIFDAYCAWKGLTDDAVKFMFDGQRIPPESTPLLLDLEDGDSIDVMLQQMGD